MSEARQTARPPADILVPPRSGIATSLAAALPARSTRSTRGELIRSHAMPDGPTLTSGAARPIFVAISSTLASARARGSITGSHDLGQNSVKSPPGPKMQSGVCDMLAATAAATLAGLLADILLLPSFAAWPSSSADAAASTCPSTPFWSLFVSI